MAGKLVYDVGILCTSVNIYMLINIVVGPVQPLSDYLLFEFFSVAYCYAPIAGRVAWIATNCTGRAGLSSTKCYVANCSVVVHVSCVHQTWRAGVNQLTGVPCASELTCLSIHEIVVRIGLNSYSQTIFCTFCELRPVVNKLCDRKQ